MNAWLMDVYRNKDELVLWIKTPDDDIRLVKSFKAVIYVDVKAADFLYRNNISFTRVSKKTYMRRYKEVLRVPIPKISCFEKFIRDFEKGTRHRIPIYNADIKPEQMFLYKNDLRPCSAVEIEGDVIIPLDDKEPIPLKTLFLNVIPSGDIYLDFDLPIEKICLNEKVFECSEEDILRKFSEMFKMLDPDVIMMDYAYSRMPYLYSRLKKQDITCPINRWDDYEVRYRGGRSFWSYGQVRYRDYAVRLHGRFLIDRNSFVGTECEPEGVMELVQLSGTLFQQTASRSFGSAFQTALMREMVIRKMLVPYKEKPIEKPLSMFEMLKADRAAHTFDPKTGFHRGVAEIDFTSMFPWLIYNHNISADCILSDIGPFASIPNVPIKTSMAYKGLIPIALKPFIDRRMYYKRNPTAVNKRRAQGLKWVLVSCYGYLRFREFKLGIPTSHMAIGAFARETLLKVVRIAEEKGFEVVHAIVDSLFIKKKGITEEEVSRFCKEVELLTGIPISFDGVFKWIVFLPSVVDKNRALPSTYYGVFRNGEIKARGIEVRQRSVPEVVKVFQQNVLEYIRDCDSKADVVDRFSYLCQYLREVIYSLPALHKDLLIVAIRVAKSNYASNIPQKIIVEKLKSKGVRVEPGQFIKYVFQKKGVVLPEEYDGCPDVEQYKKLLIRALFVVMQPFGFSKQDVAEFAGFERQTKVPEYYVFRKIKYDNKMHHLIKAFNP